MAPLNDTEIVIMGGIGDGGMLDDVIIFDTITDQCLQVVSEGGYAFEAYGNQCVQAGQHRVVALVTPSDFSPTVIEWFKGNPTPTVL